MTRNHGTAHRFFNRESNLRDDVKPAMRELCPDGWTYSESTCKEHNSDDKGYYISECKMVMLAPDDAHELFCHHNWKQNRKLREKHAEQLSGQIVAAVNIAIAVCDDKCPKVINGQHTLWAIHLRGLETGEKTQAAITVYQCRDKQAMAKTYAIFDSGRNRAASEGIEAAKQAGGFDTNLKSKILARWATCVAFAENDWRRPQYESNSKKVERCEREDVQRFAEWMEAMVPGHADRRMASRVGIGGAFFALFCSAPGPGSRFVDKFITGAGLEAGHPVLTLRNKLLNFRPTSGQIQSGRIMTEWVLVAWNYYLNNKLLSLRGLRRCAEVPSWKNWRSS